MVFIHPSSIVGSGVRLGVGVVIGPFCYIDGDIEIGDDCKFISHVTVFGNTKIGAKNTFHPFSCIGNTPQDLKFKGEKTFLEIGDSNTFRESVTVHSGTPDGGFVTRVGNKNLLMACSHIAHDVQLGNGCIAANYVGIAGHCIVEDNVVMGGMSGIHQFVKIGKHSMIGGGEKVRNDVPPFAVIKDDSLIRGVNIVGLTRHGFSKSDINIVLKVYRAIFFENEGNFYDRVAKVKKEYSDNKIVQEIVSFVEQSQVGKRKLCKSLQRDSIVDVL